MYHTRKVHVCEVCDFKTLFSGGLKSHLKTRHHKTNGLIKCDYCDFCSKDRSKVNFHTKKIHENVTPVTAVTKDVTAVTKDVTSLTEDVTEDISVCSEDVTAVTNDVTKSNRNKKLFECDICGIKTIYLENLSQHITVVHLKMAVNDSDKFKCDKCDFKSVWKYLIYRHVQSAHKKVTQQ
jgi:hypothetical protein